MLCNIARYPTYPAIIKIPEEVASAIGNVVSTPNSKLIGKTGIEKKPNIIMITTRITVSKPDFFG